MRQFLFWSSIFFIFYAYAGYPLLLLGLSFFRTKRVEKKEITPAVSFIITAHNEENRISDKIDNTLKQEYPRNQFEIIVASDCSTDRTDEIVRKYQSRGVQLIRAPERKGKEAAQRRAIEATCGEILIFSDVATILPPDGIRNIVKSFSDPTIGCVSSIDQFIDPSGKVSGEGAYVRYEMFLRRLETRVNTLVGLSGSFFAARKEICQSWAGDLQSDFNTLLNTIRAGLRGILDEESIGYYKNITDEKKEYERKVRTVLRGISVFMKSVPLLNPVKYGLFAWQLFSHKLCRWLVPFAMIFAFLSNAFLISSSGFYLSTFLLQSAFYMTAVGGIKIPSLLKKKFIKLPSFFVMVNLSILDAWYRYVCGERMVSWDPSRR